MNNQPKLSHIQFTVSTVAYLIVFIAVCISVSFSRNLLMIINGLFFVVYILSLWKTGMDTYEFYDSKYFIVDMLSIAVYVNIPFLFISKLPHQEFVCRCLILLVINEIICVVWDYICHDKSQTEQGKGFHIKWTILTAIGVTIMFSSIIAICHIDIFNNYFYLVLLDVFSFIYQFILLVMWWYSEYKIERSK